MKNDSERCPPPSCRTHIQNGAFAVVHGNGKRAHAHFMTQYTHLSLLTTTKLCPSLRGPRHRVLPHKFQEHVSPTGCHPGGMAAWRSRVLARSSAALSAAFEYFAPTRTFGCQVQQTGRGGNVSCNSATSRCSPRGTRTSP